MQKTAKPKVRSRQVHFASISRGENGQQVPVHRLSPAAARQKHSGTAFALTAFGKKGPAAGRQPEGGGLFAVTGFTRASEEEN
jgi:hypothetical protein